jgi:isocitrate dehydrogenase (NAD+)
MTKPITAVLIPGDGIGPEVSLAATRVMEAAGANIRWETHPAGETGLRERGDTLPAETLKAIELTKLCLKGPLTTPIGEGFQSVNVRLRQHFDLYANIRPAKSFEGLAGLATPYRNVDLVIVRENTEGEYSGIEHFVDRHESIAEAISVTSEECCKRIVQTAYAQARDRRRKLTLAHKANILKKTQGLFLATGRKVVKELNDGPMYFGAPITEGVPDEEKVQFNDLIVDNMAMQLVRDPTRFDVIVTTNLFGDILSDLAAGLVGGLGLVGSANIGPEVMMFEAVHGSAPDIVGKGIANPTAMMMSGVMMLKYLGLETESAKMESAIRQAIKTGVTTPDIGGPYSTEAFTQHVIGFLRNL